MEYKHGVLILGGHVQALGLVRVFGRLGIPSAIINDDNNVIAKYSKFCNDFHRISMENLIDSLLSTSFKKTYCHWLVMPTNDLHVKLLSKSKQELSKYYQVGVESWDTVKLFYNKTESYPIAEFLGIPYPRSHVIESIEQLHNISPGIEFPVILKPSIMIEFYKLFHTKAIVCLNESDLHLAYSVVSKKIPFRDLIIQDIIPGSSRNQYSVGLHAINGEIVNYVAARRTRQHPIDFGRATTYAETVEIPMLLEYTARLIKHVSYNGLAEVEFKYDARDSCFKFLEVNPRSWKWHTLAEAAGVPLLRGFYHSQYGLEYEIVQQGQACWTHNLLDIAIRIQTMDFTPKAKKCSAIRAVLDYHDLLPAMKEIALLPYNMIKR